MDIGHLSPPYVKHRSVLYVLCPEAMFGKSAVVRGYIYNRAGQLNIIPSQTTVCGSTPSYEASRVRILT